MVTIIALYPGQGSQYPTMALDLYEASPKVKHLFELASEIARQDLYTLLESGSEEDLAKTEVTQLVITLANRAAHLRATELGFTFSCHAGLSLGELAAYGGAGILDDDVLFSLVRKRSSLMAQAGARVELLHGKLGMAAVIGMGFDQVEEILKKNSLEGVYPSNDNGPSQVVIAGLASSIEGAKSLLMAEGARRVLPLKVSGAFHTPFMQEATEEFSHYLEGLHFNNPTQKVISSVTAEEVTSAKRAKELLGMQLANPVRWTKVMQKISTITEKDEQTILAEVGPGTVLTGLWKNSNLPQRSTPLGTESAIQAIREEK